MSAFLPFGRISRFYLVLTEYFLVGQMIKQRQTFVDLNFDVCLLNIYNILKAKQLIGPMNKSWEDELIMKIIFSCSPAWDKRLKVQAESNMCGSFIYHAKSSSIP